MCSKGDKTFKPPTNIGKISGLKAAIVTVDGGMVEDQLTKQENSWIFKAWNMYEEPLTLVLQGIIDEADPDDDADADDADTLADTCSQRLVVDDGSSSLVSAEYSFIDNSELVSEIGGCVKG